MANEVTIEVKTSTKEAKKGLKEVGQVTKDLAAPANAGAKAFGGLNKALGIAGLGVLSFSVLLRSLVIAGAEVQRTQQFTNLLFSALPDAAQEALRDLIPQLAGIGEAFAFTAIEVEGALGAMARKTQGLRITAKDLEAAMALARVTGIGLAQAADVIGEALLGNVGPLEDQIGLVESLEEAEARLIETGGKSVTPVDVFGAALKDLRDTIGSVIDEALRISLAIGEMFDIGPGTILVSLGIAGVAALIGIFFTPLGLPIVAGAAILVAIGTGLLSGLVSMLFGDKGENLMAEHKGLIVGLGTGALVGLLALLFTPLGAILTLTTAPLIAVALGTGLLGGLLGLLFTDDGELKELLAGIRADIETGDLSGLVEKLFTVPGLLLKTAAKVTVKIFTGLLDGLMNLMFDGKGETLTLPGKVVAGIATGVLGGLMLLMFTPLGVALSVGGLVAAAISTGVLSGLMKLLFDSEGGILAPAGKVIIGIGTKLGVVGLMGKLFSASGVDLGLVSTVDVSIGTSSISGFIGKVFDAAGNLREVIPTIDFGVTSQDEKPGLTMWMLGKIWRGTTFTGKVLFGLMFDVPDLRSGRPGVPDRDLETAHGGIVTRPTRILAGEAGTEAIIPLTSTAGRLALAGLGGMAPPGGMGSVGRVTNVAVSVVVNNPVVDDEMRLRDLTTQIKDVLHDTIRQGIGL